MKVIRKAILILSVIALLSLTVSLPALAGSARPDPPPVPIIAVDEDLNAGPSPILCVLLGAILSGGAIALVSHLRSKKGKKAPGETALEDPAPDGSDQSAAPDGNEQAAASGEQNAATGGTGTRSGGSLMGETVPLSRLSETVPLTKVDETVPLDDQTPRHKTIRIYGESGCFAGQKVEQDDVIVIGRDSEKCTLCYPEETRGISAIHCCLTWEGSDLVIMDLGSTYGTFVNGVRLQKDEQTVLRPGDRFWLAGEGSSFFVGD